MARRATNAGILAHMHADPSSDTFVVSREAEVPAIMERDSSRLRDRFMREIGANGAKLA
jgi:hypothetical protein